MSLEFDELLYQIKLATEKSKTFMLKDDFGQYIISCQGDAHPQQILDLDGQEVTGTIQIIINYVIRDYLVIGHRITNYEWKPSPDEQMTVTRDQIVQRVVIPDTAEHFYSRFVEPANSP